MTHFGIFFHAHYKNAFPVSKIKFLWPKAWEHALNCRQYIVSDTNKLFKFDLDRNLNSWLKFQPNFLASLQYEKRKEHSLSAIFVYIYSIFSNRNQISLSSSKVYDKLITMTGEKVGVPMLVGELYIDIFQLTELNIKANPPCFKHARARGRAQWGRAK